MEGASGKTSSVPPLVFAGRMMPGYRDTRRRFYWIIAKDPDSHKPFLIAGGDSEDDARHKALETLGGVDFEIRGLYTRNMAHASAIVRGKRLEETHDLRTAGERIGHERSVNRMMRRRRHFST